jgi:DNA-binding NtrC family response regulator
MAEGPDSTRGAEGRGGDGVLIGTSPAIRALFEQIKLAGRERYPVWIFGEEGVDQDLVARLIQEASAWTSGTFFALDVAVLPAGLVRREIFGAEAGAIPPLPTSHDGALSRTRQGTLLIEGTESLTKEIQEELAHALSLGRFRRVGGQTEIPVECRVLASGSRPLEELAREGRIVRSLSDRLSTLEIQVPPLRDRREDVLLIAARALADARDHLERETGQSCPIRTFSEAAQERLRSYGWPGNDRELREQVRAALRLSRDEQIQAEDFVLGWSEADGLPSFRDAKRAFEKEYVTRLLRLCDGNISRAARLAEKDRKDFYDVMRRNGINPADFRR